MWLWELSFCIAAVALAAAIVFYRRPDRHQVVGVGVLVLGTILLCIVYPKSGAERNAQAARRLHAAGPVTVAHDGFIGSQACRACHPGEHASWHRSFHRTMTERATPAAVRAPWEGKLPLDGIDYSLSRRGDEFWVRTPDPDIDFRMRNQRVDLDPAVLALPIIGQVSDRYLLAEFTRIPMVDRRVVMTTGSHHMQMYWLASERYKTEVRLFPWVYQIREKRWLPYEESFVVSANMPRPAVLWNENCIACHSLAGQPGFDFQKEEFSSQVAELGISCESCHGPGKKHLERYRNPLARYRRHGTEAGDPTILNPAKLPSKQQTQICGQCHSTFTFHDQNGRLDGASRFNFMTFGFQYHAGENVEKSRRILHYGSGMPGEDVYYWKDGTSRIGGREYLGLAQTGCYQRGKMSCLSCHSMHSADPNDQIRDKMDGNHACLQCHSEIGEDITSHTHHAADSAGSSCYNCHMPRTSYALLGAIRSHRVDSPSVESSIKLGKPNACNLCHIDKSFSWTAGHLDDWYSQKTSADVLKDQTATPAWAQWLLRGDAAQRVIAAANARFDVTRDASGDDWQAPLLAQLLTDDYPAIRFVAFHALREHPGFAELEYERLKTPESRKALQDEVLRSWEAMTRKGRPALLQRPDGKVDRAQIRRLLEAQDRTQIQLIE